MLYTRNGDSGETGSYDSKKRIPKDSVLPEALGTLDELNSFLGVIKTHTLDKKLIVAECGSTIVGILFCIQQNLFIVGSELAGSDKKISKEKVGWIEKTIANIEKELPEIKQFRIAGGTRLSAELDYARAIARRLERKAITAKAEAPLSQNSYQFLNRLSSLLYALARLANAHAGIDEDVPNYE
jgi:cob(I)alamin adenosyltransferase